MSRGREAETRRVRRIYDRTASRYDRDIGFFENVLFKGGREWVCSRARGQVLEIGVGTGRNLAHYAADVRLTGIEVSPAMLDLAKERAQQLSREADLHLGDAQALEFPDASFDTVVSTLVLCSVPDDGLAIREARRVLRPGGRFLLLEHVRSDLAPVRAMQHLLDPLAMRFQADHLTRQPLDHLRNAGFAIETVEHRKWGIVQRIVARC